ncbi:dethiobiotin synthase [Aliidiomarina iranensis]|uniref:ATP-dependent dethiobiotin synthetase BioD n=1 Tax=Aliidiomarina iranensis TaxID=1434071 RepID=A0A432W0X5_9GAMM|nr:dethiobiotin synthase [Aliidiomarina iranensis]RUO22674.1 dethiobiotin synthase [Aliidiomarina iranensis]
MRKLFITGTDTDVGKTEVATLLLKAMAQVGLETAAMKPIAAGCENGPDGQLLNSDALKLQAAATLQLPYEKVNPFAFAEPIAPHIAAMMSRSYSEKPSGEQFLGTTGLNVSQLLKHWQNLAALDADVLLTEGAGGWQLPINALEDMPSFVQRANMDVVVVVGMRLGCLNHALLTIAAIQALGLKVAGWVANQVSSNIMPYYSENIATLRSRINAPLLAEVPYFAEAQRDEAQREWLQKQNWLSQLALA